mmetsp:Transcript_17540/g.36836  ORF Transcript_17540/g.36836 Transcript_17540/m.36836 type:complete len:219 (-) Transcript_17540:74-730(-)
MIRRRRTPHPPRRRRERRTPRRRRSKGVNRRGRRPRHDTGWHHPRRGRRQELRRRTGIRIIQRGRRTSHPSRHGHVRRRRAPHSHPHSRSRRTEPRPHPAPLPARLLHVVKHARRLVQFLLPPLRQWRHDHSIRSHDPLPDDLTRGGMTSRPKVGLLGRGQAHGTGAPFREVFFVVEFEVFAKFPAAALLFAAGSGIVGQVGVGVIVEEAGHRGGVGC